MKKNELDAHKALEAKRRSERQESALGWTFLSPYAIHYIAFSLVPLTMGLVISFCRYSPYDSNIFEFMGLRNYLLVFQDNIYSRYFWGSLGTTILFGIISVPCLIAIPLLMAYLVNLQPPGHQIFRAILYMPSVVSVSVMGIIFTSIFLGDPQGLFNAYFGTKVNFLNDPENPLLRWTIILIASIWWGIGSNFVIFLAALRDVPKSLYEACEMDGGGRWQSFRKVTLPNIAGAVKLCTFSTLIGSLGLYGQPTVLRGTLFASQYDTPMMLIRGMMDDINKASLTGYITAIAIVFGAIIMLFAYMQELCTRERKGGDKYGKRYAAYLAGQKNAAGR